MYHISSEATFNSLLLTGNVGVNNFWFVNDACTTIDPLIRPKPYAKNITFYVLRTNNIRT